MDRTHPQRIVDKAALRAETAVRALMAKVADGNGYYKYDRHALLRQESAALERLELALQAVEDARRLATARLPVPVDTLPSSSLDDEGRTFWGSVRHALTFPVGDDAITEAVAALVGAFGRDAVIDAPGVTERARAALRSAGMLPI